MHSCPHFQDLLAEYAAAEPAGVGARREYDALWRHLAECAACRAELARLRQVEAALRAWPLAPLQRDLARSLLTQLAREPRQPGWHWLPWTIWLPALVIALSLGLALAAGIAGQSPQPASLAAPVKLGIELTQTAPINMLHQPLDASGSELFWAIWCGLFLTLAGLGVSLGIVSSGESLANLSSELRERWEHLREAVRL